MRQVLAVALALSLGVVGCCFQSTAPDATATSDAQRVSYSPAANTVVVAMALLERPVGDSFLNEELWLRGNEQCIDLEKKPILEENGLRVGMIGGMLPPRLLALLQSPRTCPDPRQLRGEPDQPIPLQIGGDRPRVTFEVRHLEGNRTVSLTEATCLIELTPILDGDKNLKLRFTPRVRHGKARAEPEVARNPDGSLRWEVEAKEPIESFERLCWEMKVAPAEYVLIGARGNQSDTLGSTFFHSVDGRTQRLLVLRAARWSSQPIDETITQAPPLALQATWTARGAEP